MVVLNNNIKNKMFMAFWCSFDYLGLESQEEIEQGRSISTRFVASSGMTHGMYVYTPDSYYECMLMEANGEFPGYWSDHVPRKIMQSLDELYNT